MAEPGGGGPNWITEMRMLRQKNANIVANNIIATIIDRKMTAVRANLIQEAISEFKGGGSVTPDVILAFGLTCTAQDVRQHFQTEQYQFSNTDFILPPRCPSVSGAISHKPPNNKEDNIAFIPKRKINSHCNPDLIATVSRNRKAKRVRTEHCNSNVSGIEPLPIISHSPSTKNRIAMVDSSDSESDSQSSHKKQSNQSKMSQSSDSENETIVLKKKKSKKKHKKRKKHRKKKSKKESSVLGKRKNYHDSSDNHSDFDKESEANKAGNAQGNAQATANPIVWHTGNSSSQILVGQSFIWGKRAKANIVMTCSEAGKLSKDAKFHCPFYTEHPIQFLKDRPTLHQNIASHLWRHVAARDFENYPLSAINKMPKQINVGFADECGFLFPPGIKKSRIWDHILTCVKTTDESGDICAEPSKGYYLFKCSTDLPKYMYTLSAKDKVTDKAKVVELIKKKKYVCLGNNGPPIFN